MNPRFDLAGQRARGANIGRAARLARAPRAGPAASTAPRQAERGRGGGYRGAFTLIELLTVIAIIAVLATLLMTALGAAKKKSRAAVCTGNLHQICLALNMYLDDFPARPQWLSAITQSRYLDNPRALLCPEDPVGNWGGLVTPAFLDASLNPGTSGEWFGRVQPEPFKVSYLHPLSWEETEWQRLMRVDPQAGLVACQLHGLGRADPESPSMLDYEGLVLRGQRDGAVVRRTVYWARLETAESPPFGIDAPEAAFPDREATAANDLRANDVWRLFSDKAR